MILQRLLADSHNATRQARISDPELEAPKSARPLRVVGMLLGHAACFRNAARQARIPDSELVVPKSACSLRNQSSS